MMIRNAVCLVCVCSFSCLAQAVDALEKLRALNLPVIDGVVPVIHSPSAKPRAAIYRSALEKAHAWYEEQLGIQVPATLAVLDEQDWKRANAVPYPMPNAMPGLVTLPAKMEDFPGFWTMGIEATILTETISFHELAHLFASALGIGSGNLWVNELVANIFAQEYIRAHQPLLRAHLPAPLDDSLAPRYTSLADLDYLQPDGVSASNYAWFQFRLNQLAFRVAQKHDLRPVVRQLEAAFPAARGVRLPIGEAIRRLEAILPGFTDALGPLSGAATLATVEESACALARPGKGAPTFLVIDNRSAGDLVVTQSGKSPMRVASGKWRRLALGAGEQVTLSNGSCLVASVEPALAAVTKP